MCANIRGAILLAGLLALAACGGGEPPVVQVSGGSGGGIQAQTIEQQLADMQNQITMLQQQVDALRAKAGQ